MTDLKDKKLPTVAQVEEIMQDWGKYTIDQFAERLALQKEIIETTVEYLHLLKRVSDEKSIPVMACFRNDNLESIVRCAGANRGYR